jgi:hypothetical protein
METGEPARLVVVEPLEEPVPAEPEPELDPDGEPDVLVAAAHA